MVAQEGVAILGIFVADLAFRAGRLPKIGETITTVADERSPPRKQDSVLAVAGVGPCEEKCPFPRVAGQRGRSLEF